MGNTSSIFIEFTTIITRKIWKTLKLFLFYCIKFPFSWWRHQMETFSALLAICAGNSPVSGEFPVQRPVTRSFDIFFDLRLNERLSKQSWGRWFETLSCPLWRHCNVKICFMSTSPEFHSNIKFQSYFKRFPVQNCDILNNTTYEVSCKISIKMQQYIYHNYKIFHPKISQLTVFWFT